jgi:hypothetical protein
MICTNKLKEIAENKAIADIFGTVADNNDIITLRAKATAICLKYFPKADEILLNTFRDYAQAVQAYKLDGQSVHFEVNRYYREQKT